MPYSRIFCFGVEPELFFDLDLDRQTVRIPAPFAVDPEPLHLLVAADQIFDGAGDDMVNAGAAVGGRRAFVEDEVRLIFMRQPEPCGRPAGHPRI